jgi:threonine/homoserine efflux transporter RhtA
VFLEWSQHFHCIIICSLDAKVTISSSLVLLLSKSHFHFVLHIIVKDLFCSVGRFGTSTLKRVLSDLILFCLYSSFVSTLREECKLLLLF